MRYSTGERVLIEFKILAKVKLGKCSAKLPVFMAEIVDDSILGADFLQAVNLENVFESAFSSQRAIREIGMFSN